MTTATMTSVIAPVTDDQIDAAILAALETTDDELVPWHSIRSKVPGDRFRKASALVRLFERHDICVVKLGGRNYVRLGTDWDRIVAAAERERRAPGYLSHNRTFLAV